MMTLLNDTLEPAAPTPEESALAQECSRRLARFFGGSQPRKRLCLRVQTEDNSHDEETVSIPVSAFRLLNEILTQMAQGNSVTIIPMHAELTTSKPLTF